MALAVIVLVIVKIEAVSGASFEKTHFFLHTILIVRNNDSFMVKFPMNNTICSSFLDLLRIYGKSTAKGAGEQSSFNINIE